MAHETHQSRRSEKAKVFALYLRVSSASQSVNLQKDALVQYAELRGWSYVIYEDTASGTTASRKMLQKLLADCRSRKLDGVAVWKLDRLFRSLSHAVDTLRTFEQLGVEFYSHSPQIDLTTAAGRLMANLLSAFSEFEADLIRTRVLAGLQAARARGVKLGRPSALTPDLEREIIRLRFEEKVSFRGIEKRLNRLVSKATCERVIKDFLKSKLSGIIPDISDTS